MYYQFDTPGRPNCARTTFRHEVWFQHKAHFALTGVTSDATLFNHALVRPNENLFGYEILKEHLIRRLSVSETTKPNYLLTELTLGGQTPSQLLREIRQLAGDMVGPALLQSLWLQWLSEGTS